MHANLQQRWKFTFCQSYGTGYPRPHIFWSKYSINETHLSTSSVLNIRHDPKNDGTYYYHLKNSGGYLKAAVTVAFFADQMSSWTSWSECNSTCGAGFQFREREGNIPTGLDQSSDSVKCFVNSRRTQHGKPNNDEDTQWWYTVSAVILCAVLLTILLIIWVARINRENSEVPVLGPLNKSIIQPPSSTSTINQSVSEEK